MTEDGYLSYKDYEDAYPLIEFIYENEKVLTLQKQKKDLYEEIVEGNGGASTLSEDDIKYVLS